MALIRSRLQQNRYHLDGASRSHPCLTASTAQTSQNQGSSTAVISVPDDALAGSTQVVALQEAAPGTLDTVALNVNVNQRHEVTIDFVSTAQNGRTDQIVRFPFIVTTKGTWKIPSNSKFVTRIRLMQPPQWAASYSDSIKRTQPGTAQPGPISSLFLDVNVEGEEMQTQPKFLQELLFLELTRMQKRR